MSMENASASPRRLWKEMWAVVAPYRERALAALLFLVLAKVATVVVPLVLKRIVDTLSHPEAMQVFPVALLIGYAALRFSSTLFTELRDLSFSRVTQHTVATFALKVFSHLHALGARFHAQRRTGGLLPDIDRGTNGIAFILGVGLFTVVPTMVEIGLVLAIITMQYDLSYAAIIIGTFILYSSFTVVFTARRAIYQRRANRLDSSAKSRLTDSLINYEAVKYFTSEHEESSRFRSIMEHWSDAAFANQRALFTLHVGQSAIIAIGVASIMLLAGHGVFLRAMTVGDLVLINAYVLQICLPLNALGFAYRELRDAMVNAERLFQLLREPPEIRDLPGQPPLAVREGRVVFDNVHFAYDAGRPILRGVSFEIPAGRTIAVVGGSGSGKSTLARLLLRFYDPSGGRITIDDQDLSQVTASSVRRAIGVVPQDTILFNDTIGYNIGYGRLGATHDDVVAASEAAHIHAFIESLPLKYDTVVGERGVKLSGGERQRIAVARAILKNPPILILDEATSALDLRSEHAIQQELDRLAKNRTALVIAHRLSTIVDADEIIVLEKGAVVERGTHHDLLARNGNYAELWHLQQRAQQLEELEYQAHEYSL